MGLIQHYGLSEGLEKAHTILGYVRHRIIPATKGVHDIRIRTATGKVITGEGSIIQCQHLAHTIRHIELVPPTSASPEALEAIRSADVILLGPGTLYTSLIASLLPAGMAESFQASKARKFFIANAANFPPGHCDGYTLATYLEEIRRCTGVAGFDAILAHDGTSIPASERLGVSGQEGDVTVMDVLDDPTDDPGGQFDSIKRSTLRHDGKKVAEWIKKYFH